MFIQRVNYIIDNEINYNSNLVEGGIGMWNWLNGTNMINFYYKFNLIELANIEYYTFESRLKIENILKAMNPFANLLTILKNFIKYKDKNKVNYHYKKSTLIDLLQLATVFSSFVFFIRHILIILVHYRRDYILNNWYLGKNSNDVDNKTFDNNFCSLRKEDEDTNSLNNQRYQSIKLLNNLLLNYLGDPLAANQGLSIMISCIILIIHGTYFYWSLYYISANKIHFDYLAFILNPCKQGKKVRLNINIIIDNLKNQVLNISCLTHYKTILNCNKFLSTNIFHRKIRYDMSLFRYNEIESILRNNINILDNIKNNDLVIPINLSKKFHKKSINLFNSILIFQTIMSILLTALFSCILTYYELTIRITQRYQMMLCRNMQQHSENIILDYNKLSIKHDYFDLNSLTFKDHIPIVDLSDKDQILWIKYVIEKSYFDLYILELRYYFNFRTTISYLEIELASIYSFIWASTYSVSFLLSHVDRIVFIDQINKQLNNCIELINYFLSECIKNDYNQKLINGNHDVELFLNKLHENITISYINYELFRRQIKEFKVFASFLSLQGFIICITTLTSIYILGATLQCTSRLILLSVGSVIIICFNVYLFLGAILADKIHKTQKLIIKLIATKDMNNIYPKSNYILNFWQRQYTDIEDTEILYLTNVFGVYFGYNKLLTFNGYLVALWILLLRIEL